MFNIRKYTIAFAVFLGLGITACDDLLETEPKQSVTPELALKDLDGVQALLYSAYARTMEFTYYGQTMNLAPDALADNVKIATNTGRYVDETINLIGSHVGIWSIPYEAINFCNLAIKYVNIVEGSDEAKKRIEAEAKFLRALYYFDLVKVYGYEPGQEVNGFDLGVILRLEPTEALGDADLRARSTVTEVYTQIELDLKAAIEGLSIAGEDADYLVANKTAAQLLLARLYLYWGKNDLALQYADEGLSTAPVKLVNVDPTETDETADYTDYFDVWTEIQHPESLFEIAILEVNWNSVDGVNESMHSMTTNVIDGSQFVVAASDELVAAHETGDYRLMLWESVAYNGAEFIMSHKWQGEKGNYVENIPVLRLPELYLIKAEAAQKLGQDQVARDALNMLRTSRGLSELTATTTGQILFDRIMNERRVEYAFEGHRFFDLKRNGMDIPKPNGNTSLSYNDYRVLARVPISQIIVNENLEQNPNY